MGAQFVELERIRLDGGTQPRAAIIEEVVQQYAEDLGRGDAFPPMVLFYDGAHYWLADGFHRYHAARARQLRGLSCDVRQGTQREAILYSVGANADHGLRRTNEDKRRAVLRLLNDPEWAVWGDAEVARACRVSRPFVAGLRPVDTCNAASNSRIFLHPKTGRPTSMNTENIGRRAGAAARPLPPLTQPDRAPEREAAFAPMREDMEANGAIFDALDAIKTKFGSLPSAEETARRFPRALRHTFSPNQARHIGAYFEALAVAWEAENGEANVLAAE